MDNKLSMESMWDYTAKTRDFKVLMDNLTPEQMRIIESVLAMYENDELIVVNDNYGFAVDYANKPDEIFPYKNIVLWYEGEIGAEDLIAYMNEMCL